MCKTEGYDYTKNTYIYLRIVIIIIGFAVCFASPPLKLLLSTKFSFISDTACNLDGNGPSITAVKLISFLND